MHDTLIQSLLKAECFPHPCAQTELIETHISWIILTGDFAYKIKKPVNLGFLDFTSLAQRKQYCEAELKLNARAAPEIYVGLVAIGGRPEAPSLNENDAEDAFEYAIKMHQFEQQHLFSELCESGQLQREHIDQLADKVAAFHEQVKVAGTQSPYGDPEQIITPMRQNFSQIRELLESERDSIPATWLMQLEQVEAWTESTFERLRGLLLQRQQEGFVRECHGDLHLGNITLFRNHVTLFDCIEFNNDFRWIDVISDIAFLFMDLEDHQQPAFANRLLNNYLEQTGDYAGLRLLGFYKAYRAVVRAKIALFTLRGMADDQTTRDQLWMRYQRYMDLAESCSHLPNRMVLTMHGLSGTGKSTVAMRLVDRLGMVRIRSDVERKRLLQVDAHSHPEGALAQKLYSPDLTHKTYEKLAELTEHILDAGLSVIVDATNLKHWQRARLQAVADSRGVPLCIAYCQASMSVIKQWIQKRLREDEDVSDAHLGIVDKQIAGRDPLDREELKQTFIIHSNIIEETNELVGEIRKRFFNP
ncbi:MAG: AAA family ATPase [Oleiphilaceae bacterium]|nr:AAA family ATPase [Oleiphilaceae bacterium]